jgi:hypothetical protein
MLRSKKVVAILGVLLLGACGGESVSNGTGGAAGSAATAGSGGSGGSGGSATGGSGGSATGGSGGSATGGSGGDACNDPSLKTCSGAGQCVLTTSNCCLCGTPEITDFVAMNQASSSLCGCDGPMCGCATMNNPSLAASCESGQCAAWDVRQRDDYSGCTQDSECRLREGLGCCEGCSGSQYDLVAIRVGAESALAQAMCPPNTACAECAPQYPSNASAACIAGHCQVVIAL